MLSNFLQDGARASRILNEEPILTELVVDCETVTPKPKIDSAFDRRREIAIRQSKTQTKDMTQQSLGFAALRKAEEMARTIVHSEVCDFCWLHALERWRIPARNDKAPQVQNGTRSTAIGPLNIRLSD